MISDELLKDLHDAQSDMVDPQNKCDDCGKSRRTEQ